MNKNKQLHLHEGMTKRDNAKIVRGHVVAYVHGTDTVLFEDDNKVILPGSAFTAIKHFANINLTEEITPSYNEVLDLDYKPTKTIDEQRKNAYIYLFAVGTGGCSAETSQVIDVSYTNWIGPNVDNTGKAKDGLVPFRCPNKDNDLDDKLRGIYFGRKTGVDKIFYYFKSFNEVKFVQQYIDGTKVYGNNVYNTDSELQAETYVEIKMCITPEDCREFFSSSPNDARINSISLLEAIEEKVTVDGIEYTQYAEIRPVTRLNFPTEALVDDTKGIDIVYSLFY